MSEEIDISHQPFEKVADIAKFTIRRTEYSHQRDVECRAVFGSSWQVLSISIATIFIDMMAMSLRDVKERLRKIHDSFWSVFRPTAWYMRRKKNKFYDYVTRFEERFGVDFLENFLTVTDRHNRAIQALHLFVTANFARYGAWEAIPENVQRVIVDGYERIREGYATITRDATIAASAGSLEEADAEFLFPPEECIEELKETKREMMTAARGTQDYSNLLAGFEKRLATTANR